MSAFKRDYSRGKPTGRLLRYKPETGTIDILATNIFFANGVAVGDANETVILVSETSLARVIAVHLDGDKVGAVEKVQNIDVFIDTLPGYPDGADCSLEHRSCFFPIPTLVAPIMIKLSKLGDVLNTVIRTLMMTLPPYLLDGIKVESYGGIVEVILDNGHKVSKAKIIQDPYGKEIGFITGVTLYENRVYLGSLRNNFIGRYDID